MTLFSVACRIPPFASLIFLLVKPEVVVLAQSLPASSDAHVNSEFPNANFGDAPFLQVGGRVRTYIKFDLSSLHGGRIGRACLMLWAVRVANPGLMRVAEVAGP